AKYFPGRRARHFLDELDLAHALVIGDPLLHESDELLRRGLAVRAQLDESLWDFTRLFVGLSDDSGVGDRGVLAEHRFDLGRARRSIFPDAVRGTFSMNSTSRTRL